MSPTLPEILFSDNHLIAVNKPAGMLTQSSSRSTESLLEVTRAWIKEKYQKPGKPYLGLLHRLDRPVAGVVLFARTSKAAGRLSQQFRDHSVEKYYRAWVEGAPQPEEVVLIHYLRKEKSKKSTVFPRPTPEAKKAELHYHVLQSTSDISEMEIQLMTGRFHQIRAQLSFIGHPVLGDMSYRSRHPWIPGQIALYASKLIFTHPVTLERITVEAPLPVNWSTLPLKPD